MIKGRFNEFTGRPYVRGRLFLPRFRIHGYIDFLVDTGADTTTLHPPDALRLDVNYNQLHLSTRSYHGIGGVEYPYEELAYISFDDNQSVCSYRIDVSIPESANHNMFFPSLLGQDVIKHWRMVHDKPRDRLTFTVQKADLSVPRGSVPDEYL